MKLRFALALVLAGCKADLPDLTDANMMIDAKCVSPHADTVVDFFPTSLMNTAAALRAPDTMSIALAKDNVLTVAFIGLGGITDAQGNDVRVLGMVEAGASALVRVAGTDMNFRYAQTLTPTVTEIDIGAAEQNPVIYVRVIVVAGTVRIDSFEAIHDTCQ
jgi:hypothetical protein